MTHLRADGNLQGTCDMGIRGPTNIKWPILAIQRIQHSDVVHFYAVCSARSAKCQIYLSPEYSDFFICHYKYLHTLVTSGRMKVWRLSQETTCEVWGVVRGGYIGVEGGLDMEAKIWSTFLLEPARVLAILDVCGCRRYWEFVSIFQLPISNEPSFFLENRNCDSFKH